MKLNFRTLGEGDPLIIMHGVFGSSDNWQTLGKVFAENFKVYLVDLRNHGNSPHSDEFDYDVMVKDVVELMDDEGLKKAHILGHSMGGKVAMHLATQHADRVDKLIVVDIAPKYYPPHHQQIFEGFHSVDLDNLENRKDADEQMAKVISNFGVRQFILKNLDRKKDGSFGWKLNIDAIERAIENVGEGIEGDVSFDGTTLFIAGSKSDYITEEDHDLIREHFPKALIASVKDAGHWVHAEKPKELGEMVMEFLS
ncbi:alpha/beta fold hydrolase [Ekhidna sp.]|jgi:esterase|uniref:alpha/beta fold hydrolase n=1 Tax=Ekhidna sp. TaxID=2608089 RepID=UPI0032EC517B